MIYCFDLDGTICDTKGMDYESAIPNHVMVRRIQALAGAGHEIKYYTARGMAGGTESSREERSLAVEQIKRWGLPPGPVYAKPYADVYVDDHAVNVRDW